MSKKNKTSASKVVIAAALVAVAIILLVFMINILWFPQNDAKRPNRDIQEPETVPSSTEETDKIVGGSLLPEDLDFWDKYPEETIENKPVVTEKPVENPEKEDPSKDGRHTLVKTEEGGEEWVLINQYIPKNSYDFTKLVCQSGVMKYYEKGKQVSTFGVDISKHQGKVDFQKLKEDGVDFVILRVGTRGYSSGQIVEDDFFIENLEAAKEAGLKIGVYFSSQAITKEEVLEEVNLVLERIEPFEITYPVVLDMEPAIKDISRIDRLSKEVKTDLAKTFLDEIKKHGYKPMLYGDKSWLIQTIDLAQLAEYDVWLNQNEDIPDYPYRFSMWKYSHEAVLDGIEGRVDYSISFVDYSEQ